MVLMPFHDIQLVLHEDQDVIFTENLQGSDGWPSKAGPKSIFIAVLRPFLGSINAKMSPPAARPPL